MTWKITGQCVVECDMAAIPLDRKIKSAIAAWREMSYSPSFAQIYRRMRR
jgi:hypothetical protein